MPNRQMHLKRRVRIKQTVARRVEKVILLVLFLIAMLHLLRLVTGTEIRVADFQLPLWTSVVGFLGPALLGCLFWWSHR